MKRKRCLLGVFILGTSLLLFTGTGEVFGANFPTKLVTTVVGFSPGAGIDIEARGIAPFLQKHLGVQVVIDNVPGADAKIGLTRVWRAKRDGYTLMIHTTTMSIIGEYLLNPEYRIAGFSHIFSWSQTNSVLVVNSENWKTFDDFVKAGRERVLSSGLPGRGTASHLSGLILESALGIKVNWVPFDGSGDALTALAGKHIDFASVATTSALPLVKAGKLRALVVMANSKDIVFPDVPLAKDLGYKFTVIPMLRGADGPPNMAPDVVKVLEDAFAKAVKEPEYLAWAKKRMMEIAPLNHKEYGEAIDSQQKEIEKYKTFLKGDK